MKKLPIIALSVGLLVSPISPLATETTALAAQSHTNYDAAVEQGRSLNAILSIYNNAINKGELITIDMFYDTLTSEIRQLEIKIGKVSGASNRERLAQTYLVPAKIAVERTIYEVSQSRLMDVIIENIFNYEFGKVERNTAKLERLKQRAVAIKQAGGYAALPAVIDQDLRYWEADLQGFYLSELLYEYSDAIDYYEDIDMANELYNNLTKQMKLTQQKIGKVAGKAYRAELDEFYVLPVKMEIERTIYEISQYRLLNMISDDLYLNSDTEKAQKEFAKLERLKNRAVEIKATGGYAELVAIEEYLRNMEFGLTDYLNLLVNGGELPVDTGDAVNELWSAISNSDTTTVQTLLTENTFNLNELVVTDNTINSDMLVLQYAAEYSNVDIVKLLIDHGADPLQTNIHGQDAMGSAIIGNNIEIVQYFLDNHFDASYVNVDDNVFQRTPLMYAAGHERPEITQLLINSGADFNAQDQMGQTALMWAASYNHVETARVLLENGADTTLVDGSGLTVFDMPSADYENYEAMVALLDSYR
ncbi:ankyrin repeat domain-containing protein [Metabacillus litoralis]|uniref:ankyrin repeat domain-containing protein n=1 Tax=Metabacillus litoralis TaxID=152268 RepID=UPI000EF5F832|nr:ankyrin repeat domain-containing protein [Metabacillus litoralis]